MHYVPAIALSLLHRPQGEPCHRASLESTGDTISCTDDQFRIGAAFLLAFFFHFCFVRWALVTKPF